MRDCRIEIETDKLNLADYAPVPSFFGDSWIPFVDHIKFPFEMKSKDVSTQHLLDSNLGRKRISQLYVPLPDVFPPREHESSNKNRSGKGAAESHLSRAAKAQFRGEQSTTDTKRFDIARILPNKVFQHEIFTFLTDSDVRSARLVSTKWKALAKTEFECLLLIKSFAISKGTHSLSCILVLLTS